MTLAFEPHHRGAVPEAVLCLWAFQFAKVIVYCFNGRGNTFCRSGIKLSPRERQFSPRCFYSVGRRKGRLRLCSIGCSGSVRAASTTTRTTWTTRSAAAPGAAGSCRGLALWAGGSPLLAIPFPGRRSCKFCATCSRPGSLVGQLTARSANHSRLAAGSGRVRAGARTNDASTAAPATTATTSRRATRSGCCCAASSACPGPCAASPCAAGAWIRIRRVARHKERALYAQTIEVGPADILPEGTVSSRMRPKDDAFGIGPILRRVGFQPIHNECNILSCSGSTTLDRDTNHPILRGPYPDIVVEQIRLHGLLFDLVAGATRDIDEDGPIVAAFLGNKHINQILGLRTVGEISHQRDSRVELNVLVRRCRIDGPVRVVVILPKQRPHQFRRAP